jgi:hypothetical protein
VSRGAARIAAVALLSLFLGSLATWKIAPAVPRQYWYKRQTTSSDIGEFRVYQARWMGGVSVSFWRPSGRLEDIGTDPRPLDGVQGWKDLPVRMPGDTVLGRGEIVQVIRTGWPCRHLEERITSRGRGSAGLSRIESARAPMVAANVGVWSVIAAPAAFAVVMGIVAAMQRRAQLRRRLGICEGCGYDLRGIAATVPCPECGREREDNLSSQGTEP